MSRAQRFETNTMTLESDGTGVYHRLIIARCTSTTQRSLGLRNLSLSIPQGAVGRFDWLVQKISMEPKLLSDRLENHENVSPPGGNAGHMSAELVFT